MRMFKTGAIYALCAAICVASYVLVNQNMELSLLPHKMVLSALFNLNFTYVGQVGYREKNGLFIIGSSCSGVKLFISLFLIMVFGFLHTYRRKITTVMTFLPIALIVAFAATLIRIGVSVPFCTWSRFQLIHNIISLIIYFMTGLILYAVFNSRRRNSA